MINNILIKNIYFHINKYNQTYNSNNTAQSGKNRRCVKPAPCIPINISVL